jgi:hypothetical protein
MKSRIEILLSYDDGPADDLIAQGIGKGLVDVVVQTNELVFSLAPRDVEDPEDHVDVDILRSTGKFIGEIAQKQRAVIWYKGWVGTQLIESMVTYFPIPYEVLVLNGLERAQLEDTVEVVDEQQEPTDTVEVPDEGVVEVKDDPVGEMDATVDEQEKLLEEISDTLDDIVTEEEVVTEDEEVEDVAVQEDDALKTINSFAAKMDKRGRLTVEGPLFDLAFELGLEIYTGKVLTDAKEKAENNPTSDEVVKPKDENSLTAPNRMETD